MTAYLVCIFLYTILPLLTAYVVTRFDPSIGFLSFLGAPGGGEEASSDVW